MPNVRWHHSASVQDGCCSGWLLKPRFREGNPTIPWYHTPLQVMRSMGHNYKDSQLLQILQSIDHDADGQISYEEFVLMVRLTSWSVDWKATPRCFQRCITHQHSITERECKPTECKPTVRARPVQCRARGPESRPGTATARPYPRACKPWPTNRRSPGLGAPPLD